MTTKVDQDHAEDVAADAARASTERRGLVILGQYPRIIETLVNQSERAARKMDTYGDIQAEATSTAVAMMARTLASDGMPTSNDDRALLVAVTAKRAAIHARDAARRVWSPQDRALERKTNERDAAADAVPNSLGRWSNDALIARAERFTMGDLSPYTRTVYAVAPSGECEPTTITTPSRVLAAAVLDARTDALTGSSVLAPRRILGKSTSRHAGGTVPAAESTYWRDRHALVTDVTLEAALALSGVPMSALTDLACWHPRTGTVAWQVLAGMTGLPRGTVRDKVRAAGIAARRAAKCPHTGPGTACQCAASPRVAQTILAAP